ncbi:hypothetical protein F4808DRAFT_6830 [Astrocystis sublimbata]|nr:hypothetical protein F4808DRAFT_6830 [Astrocystis sublimbata]
MASAQDPPLYRIRDNTSVRRSFPPRLCLPMTPPEPDHDGSFLSGVKDVAQDLDKLIARLNTKPIFQDTLRWHLADDVPANGEFGDEMEEESGEPRYEVPYNVLSTQMPTSQHPPEPTPEPDLVPELSMQWDPYPPMLPQLGHQPLPVSPCQSDRMAAETRAEEKILHRQHDFKRPRRGTDTRLHKSASNHRMLGLMTGMIENGLQCNVQNSTPTSPIQPLPTSSAFPTYMRNIEAQSPVDCHQYSDRMQLEVDPGFDELDEETLLNDNLALRHASTPAGIRKFGFLRYRSSSEAAQQCKNMKKSVPRMRRRRATNTTSTSTSISSPAQKKRSTTTT